MKFNLILVPHQGGIGACHGCVNHGRKMQSDCHEMQTAIAKANNRPYESCLSGDIWVENTPENVAKAVAWRLTR